MNLMTASELNRKLLFKGYDDLVDYLRNSPFNCCIYNSLLTFDKYYGDGVSMLKIINEAYFQCVRVGFDSTPGSNVKARYLDEEIAWLGSRKSAILVFNMVWAILRCKQEKTLNEVYFLKEIEPLLDEYPEDQMAHIIIKFTAGDRVFPPHKFNPMPSQVSEISYPETSEDSDIWSEITCGFVPPIVERYLELYESPKDQLELLQRIERAYNLSFDSKNKLDFGHLRNNIEIGYYHQEDEEEKSIPQNLSYKEEFEKLQDRYDLMQRDYEKRIQELEFVYKHRLETLREKCEEEALTSKRAEDGSVLLFTFTEMVDIVKNRFSKAGAAEFSNMLYQLVIKHGYLDQEVTKVIDDIVPSVIARESRHQTFEMPNVNQVNINPRQVINKTTNELLEPNPEP